MDMHYYEDFKEMLVCLNEKLILTDSQIEIRAIGGFAMMCNATVLNFDTRNASVDIDSYNIYTEKVKQLIKEVAEEFEINEDWLNTDWRDDYISKYHSEDGIIIGLEEWEWIPSKDIQLSNIISYANLEGLFAMKLRSVNEKLNQQEEPRLNDLADLIAMVSYFEKKDLSKISNQSLSYMLEHFELAKEYLMNILNAI